MPILVRELGNEWDQSFAQFDRTPCAAASIGQVHRASLQDGTQVAVKVQYPGVSQSISSDLKSLKLLLLASNLLPKGLFLGNTLDVAREELQLECDYRREANMTTRAGEMIMNAPSTHGIKLRVPRVFYNVSTDNILVTEWMSGIPFGQMMQQGLVSQATRNAIGGTMLELCLREIFTYRLMQTDPNWSNFLYDFRQRSVVLLDYGSAK